MREIKLTNSDLVAIVDEEDYERVSKHKWFLMNQEYASRTDLHIFLHKFILGGIPAEIDHKNNNKLDCRKENLRRATRSQNCANAPPRNGRKFKGVYKCRERFRAQICVNYTQMHLGVFASAEKAARAYDAAAKELFGEFAWTNFK